MNDASFINSNAFSSPFAQNDQLGYEMAFSEPDLINVPNVQGQGPEARESPGPLHQTLER